MFCTRSRLTQRFSRHPFVCAVWPFRTACFMNENKKILDGHLPVIPRPRFMHHGFRQPFAVCMRNKRRRKAFPPWVRAVSKIYNSIGEFTIPLEVCILMRGVKWALWFVTSSWSGRWSDQRCAAQLSAWWAAKRRLISNDRHGVISLWILPIKPSSFSYWQGLWNGVFVFKIRHTLTSNEARKLGLITVVFLGVVSGEVPANFERPSPSHFSLDSRQQAVLV